MCGKENIINIRCDPYAKQSNLVCLVETNLDEDQVFQWKRNNTSSGKSSRRSTISHASCGRGSGVYAFAKQVLENSPYQFVKKKYPKDSKYYS